MEDEMTPEEIETEMARLDGLPRNVVLTIEVEATDYDDGSTLYSAVFDGQCRGVLSGDTVKEAITAVADVHEYLRMDGKLSLTPPDRPTGDGG
jgi:hypothetical protein